MEHSGIDAKTVNVEIVGIPWHVHHDSWKKLSQSLSKYCTV